jgi:hypothetical protein
MSSTESRRSSRASAAVVAVALWLPQVEAQSMAMAPKNSKDVTGFGDARFLDRVEAFKGKIRICLPLGEDLAQVVGYC